MSTSPVPSRPRAAVVLPAAMLLALSLAAPARANGCGLDGSGTSLSPFLVADASGLALVAQGSCGADAHYLQTADITLSGAWTPIMSFTGTYDGGGHTIAGLVVNEASDDVGLFGSATGATFRSVRIVDGDVRGQDDTGGLVGGGGSITVIDSSFSGSVTGVDYVGGLVGYGFGSTAIARSWSAGTVSGSGDVGGLVGYLPAGGVRSSFSTADVAATDDDAAGLIGYFPARDLERLRIDGTATASTDSGGGSIVSGDAFHWSLTLDLDTALGVGTSAVLDFDLIADPSNSGTWLPDAAVWSGTHNVTTNASSDQITAQIRASSGAPAIDGTAFLDVDLTLDWDPSDVDGGASPTDLADFLGSTRPPLGAAELFVGLRDTTANSVAAFTAALDVDLPQQGDLTDVYARGDVSVTGSARWVGGLSGYTPSGNVTRAYTTGPVSVSGTGTDVGGLVGQSFATVVDSFWDTEASGQASSAAGTGRTTAQMTSRATFADTATTGLTTAWPIVAGWDTYAAGTTVWGICERVNDGYPFLLWRYDTDPCTTPTAAGDTPTVTCGPDAPRAGAPLTCTVSGAPADFDFLWRAAHNPVFAEGVVTTGADGSGTLGFTVPTDATGDVLTVELVAWTGPIPIGTITPAIPTRIDSGLGPSAATGSPEGTPAGAWLLVTAALGAGMLATTRARSGPAPRRARR